ncbi:MAG: hypothetical protein IJ087_16460 [Eggerthellaceae bacterium]|nr:hypothetical protein [Eggerthellaceae bacterium]
MAKRKMTKAQAAAARHEQTPESIQRAQAKERTQLIKQSAQAAQKKANQVSLFRLIVPFVLVAVIVIAALAFTIGPGLFVAQ